MNNKTMLPAFFLASLFSVFSQTTIAQETILPIGSQGQYLGNMSEPTHGQNQETVKSQFGQPLAVYGPHGEPPITRWDYENFSVYFENDSVIHSVRKHRRQDEPTQ